MRIVASLLPDFLYVGKQVGVLINELENKSRNSSCIQSVDKHVHKMGQIILLISRRNVSYLASHPRDDYTVIWGK